MERAEWEAIEDSNCDMHVLRIGGAAAYANGPCRCGCGEGPRWDAGEDEGDADSLDQAKGIAEAKLLDIRDALNAHFAPVLRWEDIHPSLSTAHLDGWTIDVTNGGWYLFVRCEDGRRLVRHAVTIDEGLRRAERKRAAEAALRALGVVFRTEGE